MPTISFTKLNVDLAPDEHGVYFLFDDNEMINIGRAKNTTIRARLRSHLNGHEGSCTQRATHFSWEICEYPATREKELLQTYENRYGSLPKCNDRIG